jgi:hypothetical protein
MKQIIPYLFLCLVVFYGQLTTAQITSPQIKARFGVDADLRSNFFNNALQAGNDDWFTNAAGSGISVIDTTGAAELLSTYNSNPNSRRSPLFRGMSYPQFSIVNNKTLIDAVFIRDHHGDDSSTFAAGSNKNSMNPLDWTCPVAQAVPDKNEILDMFMHVRRDGTGVNDSLWFFGGVSLDGNTGARYIDFEMYQTDIVYNSSTQQFSGYGSEAGHTTWTFDASGNVTRAGDIIFTAEYSSTSLTLLEARIWIHKDSRSITPSAFSWGGLFDGVDASSVYGYASILPKTSGAFYTGLQSDNNAWAGPFQLVLSNNSLTTSYNARQFMEFSVNLSKLGLDPLVSMNDACALPFRRLMVKTRTAPQFNAELKDFVAPFAFFRAPMAQISTNFPIICGEGVSNLWIDNASTTSLYTWKALSGNIVGDTIGTMITVNQPGTYVVRQQLMDSCSSSYANDTIVIGGSSTCFTLNAWVENFNVRKDKDLAHIEWNSSLHGAASFFQIQRSIDGVNFVTIDEYATRSNGQYRGTDDLKNIQSGWIYYRLKYMVPSGYYYSHIQSVYLPQQDNFTLTVAPNPVTDHFNILFKSVSGMPVEVFIKNQTGQIIHRQQLSATGGLNSWKIYKQNAWSAGIYVIELHKQGEVLRKRIIVQ